MTLHRPVFPPVADALPKPFQIDRRGLLCGLAALPAVASPPMPALTAGRATIPDPIFAAIEGHRCAYDAMKTAPAGLDDDEFAEYAQPEVDAADVLQETVPTTLEGLFALLTYLPVAIEQQDADTYHGLGLLFGDRADIFTVLARSVTLLIDGGQHVR
jgi:hypothetical protein